MQPLGTMMDRPPQYKQGYRAASKDAVTYLHKHAKEMRNPTARNVLNMLAFWLGQDAKRKAFAAFEDDAMAQVICGSDIVELRPLVPLRFVERGGVRILQQAWQAKRTDGFGVTHVFQEWRDVPLEPETP